MARDGIVIVGGGQAGYQVAASLRAEGYDGPVRLIAEEAHLPYQRPPLSKGYLTGKARADSLPFRPLAFYERNGIDLLQGVRVVGLDAHARRVATDDGMIAFDGLALTTGGRVRRLSVPGADADGIFYLRGRDDADAIQAALGRSEQAVVVGGGFIGLEIAASARALGKEVTVLEVLDRLMARAVAPELSDYFARLHRGNGVRVVLGAAVTGIEAQGGRVSGVRTADGARYPADMVAVGIGIIPCSQPAAAAGLACDNGILVDAHARTSSPAVVAAGDCTNFPSRYAETRVRLESVQNAIDQAKTAAGSLLGRETPYDAVPWFWSDQYDAKLQMAGLSQGATAAVRRGRMDDGRFSVFHFKGEQLIAVDSVNRPADHMLGRRLLAQNAGPTPQQAADESFDLKTLLRQPAD